MSSGEQEPDGVVINVISHSVNMGIVGAYGTKILTNIRVHIRDCMPRI